MNSLKREREDIRTGATHVYRSHRRRQPDNPIARGLAVMAAVSAAVGILSTVVVSVATPDALSERPYNPAVVTAKAPESHTVGVILPDAVAEAQERAEAADRADRFMRAYEAQQAATRRMRQIDTVVNFALAQQGKRYVFGSAGPNTFDCSGLVLAAFQEIGIQLYHYTGVMINRGTPVSRQDMQRGDLIFPAYNHVAIYLGNNMMVAASSGKGHVVVQPVYAFYAARRLV